MDARLVDVAASSAISLLEVKKRIDISDLQLPWRPLYAILDKELFPKSRKTGLTNVSTTLLSLTEYSQRFFPPHEISAMLETFLPRLSASLNSILATQAFCTHFLPLSHPQYYLSTVFQLWGQFSSVIWDEQWLDMCEQLAAKHLDPSVSDPDIIDELRQMSKDSGIYVEEKIKLEDLLRPDDGMLKDESTATTLEWKGIRKDVGIFTETQFAFIMTKCLRSMGK